MGKLGIVIRMIFGVIVIKEKVLETKPFTVDEVKETQELNGVCKGECVVDSMGMRPRCSEIT